MRLIFVIAKFVIWLFFRVVTDTWKFLKGKANFYILKIWSLTYRLLKIKTKKYNKGKTETYMESIFSENFSILFLFNPLNDIDIQLTAYRIFNDLERAVGDGYSLIPEINFSTNVFLHPTFNACVIPRSSEWYIEVLLCSNIDTIILQNVILPGILIALSIKIRIFCFCFFTFSKNIVKHKKRIFKVI